MANFVKLYVEEITDEDEADRKDEAGRSCLGGEDTNDGANGCTETIRMGKAGMLQEVRLDPSLTSAEPELSKGDCFALNMSKETHKIRIKQLMPCMEGEDFPPARGGSRAAIVENFVYVFGGATRLGEHFNDLWRCEIGSNEAAMNGVESAHSRWIRVDSVSGEPPSKRSGHSFIGIGLRRVMVFGGMISPCNTGYSQVLNDTFILEIGAKGESFVWHAPRIKGEAPSRRTEHSSTKVGTGTVLVYGGSSPECGCFGDVYVATIAGVEQVTWAIIRCNGAPPLQREMHSACLFSPNKAKGFSFSYSFYDGSKELFNGNSSTYDEAEVYALREKGNTHFKSREFHKAVDAYSNGLKLHPEDAYLYSNRSASYSCLGEHEKALQDARVAVKLSPSWAKANFRECVALQGLKEHAQAIDAIERAIERAQEDKEKASFASVKATLEDKDQNGKRFTDKLKEAPRENQSFLLIYGGRGNDNAVLDDIWWLDLETFEWHKAVESGIPRCGHSMVPAKLNNKDQTMIFGGWSGGEDIYDTAMLFNPFNERWQQAEQTESNAAETEFPSERFSHACTGIHGDNDPSRAFVFAGVNFGTDLNDLFEIELR